MMTTDKMKTLELVAQAIAANAEVSNKALDLARYDMELLRTVLSETTGVEVATPPVVSSAQVIPPVAPPKIEYPVLETPVDAPLQPQAIDNPLSSYVDPSKMFEMRLRIVKPCDSCPFASTCEAKDSMRLTKDCPESTLQAKRVALQPGEIYMDIEVVEENNRMHTKFHAYRDGLFLGDLWTETENKFARSILELYSGERVHMYIQPLKARGKVIFTTLVAEILRTEPIPKVPAFHYDVEPPEQEEEEPIVLDFKYSL